MAQVTAAQKRKSLRIIKALITFVIDNVAHIKKDTRHG